LRCTISAFSFNTNTTARRDDTTHNGSKLALSKRLLATRCSPPVPRAYRRHYNAIGRRFGLTPSGNRRGYRDRHHSKYEMRSAGAGATVSP
jgi:hypothetical protein